MVKPELALYRHSMEVNEQLEYFQEQLKALEKRVEELEKQLKDQKDDDNILRDFWGEILTFYFYLKYAKVEVYESIQKKPIKISKHEKFLVDSPLKINWVDSSWFRTIIRKEEFGVRGHFRLQNYKEKGQWVKKLIYIEPYIKHGFVRHAKIERNR